MTNDIANFKRLKFAKKVTDDMAKIIPRVEACIIFLTPFESYSQVSPIIDECKQRLAMLKAQNNRYKKIVESKGVV